MEDTCKKCLVVSIVSHGHGKDIQRLLSQLARQSSPYISRVVITHNVPEPPLSNRQRNWPFLVQTVHNSAPRGFGANHNTALKGAKEAFVCVLNPDVELIDGKEPFAALLQAAARSCIGCAYPIQLDAVGNVQDSERALPTPVALWKRCFLRSPEKRTDWVNAACIVLPAATWEAIGGFDERYFMYCEDVDLCLRLKLKGLALSKTSAQVIHPGRRNSHREIRHLVWHLRSLWILWSSLPYQRFRKKCKSGI